MMRLSNAPKILWIVKLILVSKINRLSGKKWFNFFFGLTITVVCVWLAFRKVPFTELTNIVSDGNFYWLIPAVIAQLLAILVRSQRWVILLDGKASLETSFWSQGIGYLFTNLFPFRLGEVARVLVMSEKCKLPIVQVAGTAIVERLLDVGTMILALVLVLPWMQVPIAIKNSGQIFGTLVILGMLVIIFLARFKETSFSLIDRVCIKFPFLPKTIIRVRWEELLEGLTPLLRGVVSIRVVGLSIVSWLFSGFVFFCAIKAFQPMGNFVEAVFMMASLSFAVIVPSSPGFIGVFQYIGQQALVIPFGVKYSSSNALAIALMAHFIYYIFSTLIGIIGLWRVGQSFAGIKQLLSRKNTPA
jgi:glycosyltransferase 2 family protein